MSLPVEFLSGADADLQGIFNRFEEYQNGAATGHAAVSVRDFLRAAPNADFGGSDSRSATRSAEDTGEIEALTYLGPLGPFRPLFSHEWLLPLKD